MVCWAHNSHLGDARYTHLERLPPSKRDLNLGQLVKEAYPQDSFIIGQLFNDGAVTAANEWGEPHEFKQVNSAIPNSAEDVLHAVSKKHAVDTFALDMSSTKVAKIFKEPRLQRAIGGEVPIVTAIAYILKKLA